MNDATFEIFAATVPGLEQILQREIRSLGLGDPKVVAGGVVFGGDFLSVMEANLFLRTAARVLVRAGSFHAVHVAQLHKRAGKVAWEKFFDSSSKIQVRATCKKSRIYHSKAAAQRVAQGIADRLKLNKLPDFGENPADEKRDGATVLVRLDRDLCTLSVDSSGDLLHRRGYKTHTVEAPIRENLAAALLMACNWDGSVALADPMCGSGTFPVEAAMIATNTPPGLNRKFAFMKWPQFDQERWSKLLAKAKEGIETPTIKIMASDMDPKAVEASIFNIKAAGFSEIINVEQKSVNDLVLPPGPGLLICNPPYGLRLNNDDQSLLKQAYKKIGDLAQTHNWKAALVTSDNNLAKASGLSPDSKIAPFPHGGVRVRIFRTDF